MVNLLNFSKQEYEHHMWSIYLAFGSKNMGAIGSQFTWLLQAATFTSTTIVVSCAAGLTMWLLCMCWRRLNGLGWMIMLTLPASKAQANWHVNMGAIGSLQLKNSVIELTCSSIMCCWLDYVIIVHVVKAARSLNGLGLVIMPGKPAVQAREPAMLIITHTADE